LNPTDWKHSLFGLAPPSAIIGVDLSGTIAAIGAGVKNSDLKIGDKVATVVHGGKFYDKGSFAEYARAENELVWKVPEGLELEDAATYPLALITNGQVSAVNHDIGLY
jgi:NADPH:quinone reductase-like Zn-dependent oxidoreductase